MTNESDKITEFLKQLENDRDAMLSMIKRTEASMGELTLSNMNKHISDLSNLKWYQGYLKAVEHMIERLK